LENLSTACLDEFACIGLNDGKTRSQSLPKESRGDLHSKEGSTY
jgi:hypothetical protein